MEISVGLILFLKGLKKNCYYKDIILHNKLQIKEYKIRIFVNNDSNYKNLQKCFDFNFYKFDNMVKNLIVHF